MSYESTPAMKGHYAAATRELRRHLKCTQEELAELLSVNPRTICNWEQGHRVPQATYRARVRAMLRLSARPPQGLLDAWGEWPTPAVWPAPAVRKPGHPACPIWLEEAPPAV